MGFKPSKTAPLQKKVPPMSKVNEVEFEVCDVSVEMVVVDSENGKVPVIVSEERY